MELVMFAFAIVVYFLFMGPLAGKMPKKSQLASDPRCMVGSLLDLST